MKKTIQLISGVLMLILMQSCNLSNTPEEYFDRTTLNTNALGESPSKYFSNLERYKKSGNLTYYEDGKPKQATNYVQYIEKFSLIEFQKKQDKIKDLKVTEETKPLIDNSNKLFQTVINLYKTDFTAIAKMMDANAKKEDIDKKIEVLEEKFVNETTPKYQKLQEVALPYAKKNGINVSTF